MKHKHAKIIIAFVEGIECEGRSGELENWLTIKHLNNFTYFVDARIKPEPQQDVVDYMYVIRNRAIWANESNANLKLIFDGETGKLKSAEMIK